MGRHRRVLIRLRPDPALMVLGAGIIAFVAVACAFSAVEQRWHLAAGRRLGARLRADRESSAADGICGRCASACGSPRSKRLLLVAWLVWTSGRDVLPEISRLPDAWLVLPVAAPVGVVAWLLLFETPGAWRTAALEAARRQFEGE